MATSRQRFQKRWLVSHQGFHFTVTGLFPWQCEGKGFRKSGWSVVRGSTLVVMTDLSTECCWMVIDHNSHVDHGRRPSQFASLKASIRFAMAHFLLQYKWNTELEILRVLSHGPLGLNLFIEANCKDVRDEIRLAETVEAIASSRLPKTTVSFITSAGHS